MAPPHVMMPTHTGKREPSPQLNQCNPMSAKKVRRVRSRDRGEAVWRAWLQLMQRAPIYAWVVAAALGVGLALCEADLLVPLFWQRRPLVQCGIGLAAALLQIPLLLGAVSAFLQETRIDGGPVGALARWFVGLGLGASLVALTWKAGLHFATELPVQTTAGIATATQQVLDIGIDWTYLALLIILLALWETRGALPLLTPRQRTAVPVYFLAAGFALTYLINTLLPMLDVRAGRFIAPDVVPTYTPVGMDFRRGMYLPASRLLSGDSVYRLDADKAPNLYPPLVTLMGTAYVLLSEDSAAMVHALALFAANVMCLLLAAALWRRTQARGEGEDAASPPLIEVTLLILVGASLFTGYPFLFSFERGNIDAVAMLLAVAAFLVLAVRPERMWWQVVLLSLAIYIKAYPALLLLPIFLVHRRRMTAPTLLVNVALLLCLGPANAAGFVLSLARFYEPIVWVGNYSAYSLAGIFSRSSGAFNAAGWMWFAALLAAPLLVWLVGLRTATRYESTSRFAAAAIVLTTPVMATMPGISYDYQLVILYPAILLLLAMILQSMREQQDPADYLQLLLVVFAAGMLGRSYLLMPGVPALVQNKYPWILLVQLVALAQILREVDQVRAGPRFRSGRRASARP